MPRRGAFVFSPLARWGRKALATLAALLAAASAAPASAQRDAGPIELDLRPSDIAPVVTAAAERGEALLGAPFTFFITADARPGITVALQEPLALGPFELTRKLASVKHRPDGSRVFQWQLELTAWEVGELVVPPIGLAVAGYGATTVQPTPRAPIRIVGALAEDDPGQTLRGAAPPKPLDRPWSAWIFVGGALGALAAFGALLWWRRRRRRLRSATAPAPRRSWLPQRASVFDRARHRIAELEREGTLLSEQKAGYVALAEVLRQLVAEAFGIVTSDLTTAELARAMARQPRVAGAAPTLIGWLARIDRVKYDVYPASAAEVAQAIEGARIVVDALERASAGVMAVAEANPEVAAKAGARGEGEASTGTGGAP